ncbi:N-acetyltransferase [Sphingobium jiangsuense]|uniref:Ribosomal protein S18 acetylase RimI-like enzyme n=1 Tax=Sphingobium jiangsuense TaxID=870476 RepID=A0A7W6BGW9_9SPHN|nr:GNAT family N-acetyltransferase [Sphingobium jiangsuense]MBB3926658.1 ribosomal protein S18 acetylase RimI-like enzyme [Sphingobium jiangsuense]GLT00655.1 N-acetyltransferase [Sphingobium jiangsuense]
MIGRVGGAGPFIRDASPDDAWQLAALKRRTFRETFVEGAMAVSYAEEDLAIFEEESYSPEAVRAELADPARHQWVAEDEAGELVAYAHVGPCKLPHEEARPDHGEVYQLYIVAEWQGAGLGRQLLDRAIGWLEERRPGPIWIGVFSGNLRAQAIYVSRGFVKVGDYEFRVGAHRDREFIMRRDPR